MAKASKPKQTEKKPKEASILFHNIMAASVSKNKKTAKKASKKSK